MRAIFVVAVALLGLAAGVSYEGFKVYKVAPKTEAETQLLKAFENDDNFDFWSALNTVGNPVAVMVDPKVQFNFEKFLKYNGIEYDVQIQDVESTIQLEKLEKLKQPRVPKGRIAFNQYLRHDEIIDYLKDLATAYPDIVTLKTIGKSLQNRDLVLVHITSGSGPKPRIFVDAGIHAREWIAPSVALYLINQLVENPGNSDLIQNVEWIVWPVVNPDGYEYTHEDDRLWRKTRRPGTCYGVDANRNFDFHWMETGASSNPCTETYAGPSPFSEPETQALSDHLLGTDDIHLYLTLHSYGQYLLYPWGFDSSLPSNWEELNRLGEEVNTAIASYAGTRYTVGSSTNVLYAAAGASDDYAMGVAGIGLVYTIELPGGGWYGFDLPAGRILDVAQETWLGFKIYHDHVVEKFRQ